MKLIDPKTSNKKSKNKKSVPNYSSWDPLTQARYLFDLHQKVGNRISMKEAYSIAIEALKANCVK